MGSLSQSDVLDSAAWEKALNIQQDDSTDGETSRTSNRNMISASPSAYQSDHSPTSTTSRSFPYISPGTSSYPRSNDRPTSWGQVPSRESQHYSYNGSSYGGAYGSNGVLQPSSSPTAEHGMDGLMNGTMQSSQSLAYGFRRSITESQHSRSVVDHYPSQYTQQAIPPSRTTSTTRLSTGHPSSTNAGGYGPEGIIEHSTHYSS